MEINIQNKLKNLQSSPSKIILKDFFKEKESLSFYEKILSKFVFYYIKENTNESLNDEIKSLFDDIYTRFSAFCFCLYEKKQYLIICFENHCFVFSIEKEKEILTHIKTLLDCFTQEKVYLISPNKEDYQNLTNLTDKIEIKHENFAFPDENEEEEIIMEVSEFIKSLKDHIIEYPLMNITKKCIATYIIRRFYYKKKYFLHNFFYKQFKFKKFEKKDFIILRDISQNTSLAYYKEENQLVVIKYKEESVNLEQFERDKKLFCKINEMDRFVKYYGYITNKNEEVTSLVLEFMSGGTIEEHFSPKNSRKKKKNR